MSQAIDPRELLPEGVAAIIWSSTHQPTAVYADPPWRLSRVRLPADLDIDHITGVPPVDLYDHPTSPPHQPDLPGEEASP